MFELIKSILLAIIGIIGIPQIVLDYVGDDDKLPCPICGNIDNLQACFKCQKLICWLCSNSTNSNRNNDERVCNECVQQEQYPKCLGCSRYIVDGYVSRTFTINDPRFSGTEFYYCKRCRKVKVPTGDQLASYRSKKRRTNFSGFVGSYKSPGIYQSRNRKTKRK